MCKINDIELLDHYKDFLLFLKQIEMKNVRLIIKAKEKCNAEHANPSKCGHPYSCYVDFQSCSSPFIYTLILSPHFPNVRYIKKLVNHIIQLIELIDKTDKALDDADVIYLQKESLSVKESFKSSEHEQIVELELDEDRIRENLPNAFEDLLNKSKDIPIHPCVSCEKLCYRRNITEIVKFRAPLDTKTWLKLMKFVDERKIDYNYVCHYCLSKFRENKIPSACILNNLDVKEPPKEILLLNDYEKVLIQRAKAFQVVLRMGTVSNKNLPFNRKISKVKGRTFHLPLPTEETLKKICPDDQPINSEHEFYILIRGIPNKKILYGNS